MENYPCSARQPTAFALAALIGVAGLANGQDRRDDDRNDRSNRSDRDRNDDRRDNNNVSARWRVKRGGRYSNTDNRGAELLRQAVNEGYRQGYEAGRSDRSGRRRNNWRIYRSGLNGYDAHVDRGHYQYYFQQGFQRGYDDGYNSRNRYGSNGSVLGTFLNQVLNLQSY